MRLSGGSFVRITNAISEFCKSRMPPDVEIVFDEDLLAGLGRSGFKPGERHLTIGIKSMASIFGLNMRDMVAICIAVGHEIRHWEQSGAIEGSDLSKDICVSHLACICNPYWYNRNGKMNHVCEIDAEYYGYGYGFDILSSVVGEKKAEKCLLNYLNKTVSGPFAYYLRVDDFVQDSVDGGSVRFFECESLDDLDLAFERAAKRCQSRYVPYPNSGTVRLGDEFFDVMRRGRSFHEDCLDKFVKVNHEVPQDGVGSLPEAMACLSLYMHPEYLDQYPVDLSDLTPVAVFGSDFTEEPDRMLRYKTYVRVHKTPVVNRLGPLMIPDTMDEILSDNGKGELGRSVVDTCMIPSGDSGKERQASGEDWRAMLARKARAEGQRKSKMDAEGFTVQGQGWVQESLNKSGQPGLDGKTRPDPTGPNGPGE